MTKKRWVIFLIGVASVACLWLLKIWQENPSKTSHLKYKIGSYFFPIKISEWDDQKIPCVPIQIENQTFSLSIDLGCASNVCFSSRILNGLQDKTYLKMRKSYGMRGKFYEKSIYDVPKIDMGAVTFSHLSVDEESEDFLKDAILLKEGDSYSALGMGRVGWALFKNTNLLLDLGNSKIAFCDSLDTLAKEGYLKKSFVRTPLLFNDNILQIQACTSNGPICCWLDTGATWNILNIENNENKSAEQFAWDSNHFKTIPMFKINQRDFGPIKFHEIPVQFPFHVQAILGMEFFNSHVVFLDFDKNYAYFAKKPLHNL